MTGLPPKPGKSLSWEDLRTTWQDLLGGESHSRDESGLLPLARQVAQTLDGLRQQWAHLLPAGAFLFLVNSAGVQWVMDESDSWQSVAFGEHVAGIEAFHADLDRCMKAIDPSYQPEERDRRSLDITTVTAADRQWLCLPRNVVRLVICKALHRAGLSLTRLQDRAFVDPQAPQYATRIDDLSRAALGFRLLRWRLQRLLRIASEIPNATEQTKSFLERNRKWELKALWYAAQSAGECGEFATQAAIGGRLLHEIAQTYQGKEELDEELVRAVSTSCASVRDLGYSVPDDFTHQGRFSIGTDPHRQKTGSCRSESPSRLYRIYRKVPREDFTALAAAAGGEFRDNPLRFLTHLVRNKSHCLSDTDCQKLFDACVELDRLRPAFKLLKNQPSWRPNSASLAKLARHLIVAQRALPAGIRDCKQARWLRRLCNAWGSLGTRDDHDVLIHQGVLGRMTSLSMGSGSSAIDPCLMLGKSNEQRTLFPYQFRPLVKVDGFHDLRDHVQRFGRNANTVLLSVVPRGSGLHLYAVASASAYQPHCEQIDGIELEACGRAASFLQARAQRDDLLNKKLWNRGELRPLVVLAGRLLDFVRRIDAGARVLILAMEPDLAAVPWNVLLPAIGRENVPIVSLIPSLSWLRDHNRWDLAQRRRFSRPRCVPASLEVLARAQPQFKQQFARLLETSQALVDAPMGAARSVAVGHGMWDKVTKMTVVTGPDGPITLEAWLDLFGAPLVVLNSCQGAMTEGHLIADLAGLPGLALAAGCRCLLAPLTRLKPDDLADLCEALASAGAGATVLERLNAAFARNPAVRQVAVFGDPTVKLTQEEDAGRTK